ncbi:MAG: AAA family ATPase [Clostridia bacterium]|nr:AAA family ATPase [Clostridia bacterium]
MDKKDEIISMQLDLIRSMTENNMRRIGTDFWGNGRADKPAAKIGDSPEKTAPQTETKTEVPTEEKIPPKENIEDLKKELSSYIGLSTVKAEVENLINMATVYGMRREHGLPTADMSLHMVFSGNPGTGKTMIAHFMARVYHSLGILSKGQLIEVDRSGLVAGYVGQTAIKTSKVLEKAKGGVLFIDEAYTLTSKEGNDFGYEAVDTILKAMEDNREDLVVIVAGYIDRMEGFIDSNPGLQSRFNKYLHFADYSAEEMTDIFLMQCEKNCYTPDKDAVEAIREYLRMASEEAGEFGNARGVRNVFEKVLSAQANRLAAAKEITREELMHLTKEDVQTAAYGKTE